MKRIITVLFLMSSLAFGQNAWINELHYDNTGGDVGEFVEIVVANSLVSEMAKFTITLYNGSSSQLKPYNSETGNNFTQGFVDLTNGYTFYTWQATGMQNGAPDGLTLEYNGAVLQFLSYEGTFTPVEGLASGMTSSDIGVSEDGTEAIGGSLGLIGTGTSYSDFTWTTYSDDTPGNPNSDQALPVELTTFSASVSDQNVDLNWETATEVNNYGFEIERKLVGNKWNKLDFVNGHGNSNSPKYYSYTDSKIEASGNILYRLKQIDIDGTFEYSDEVEVNLGTPEKFELNQNFPNPFNPMTSIQFNIPQDSQVRLNVFNVLGEEVSELINDNISAGYHSVNFDASQLNSGIYFYKLETNNFTQIRKMMLVK